MGMKMLICLACVASVLSGCGSSEQHGRVRPLTEVEQSLVQSSNSFGFDFFREVVAESDGGNVFVSPLSVSLALGMVYNGARTSTEEGMRAALRFGDLTGDEINEGYRGLIDLLTHLDPRVTMEIADSIWIREGFEVLQAFIDVNRIFFSAVVEVLDFDSPGAADTINAWVNEKTHGKIDSIVKPPISPLTMMYLINAIYFKGTWTYEIDKALTRDEPFHAAAGADKNVKMMRLHQDLRYCETEGFQMVDLPYGDRLFSMTVLLPREGKDIDALVGEITAENWSAWTGLLSEQEGDLSFPRFELEWEESLNDVLSAMGMEVAFTDGADLTGINPAGALFISNVKHKTYVKVNEEGTEAAAVTSVEVGATSVPQTFTMVVNRPFLFVIRDNHSDTMLFMGKIVDPLSE